MAGVGGVGSGFCGGSSGIADLVNEALQLWMKQGCLGVSGAAFETLQREVSLPTKGTPHEPLCCETDGGFSKLDCEWLTRAICGVQEISIGHLSALG